MEFYSWLFDKKVHGVNVSVDISIEDYWSLAQPILRENDLQRTRVAAKGKPYQLLKRDLIEGCVMPPIIVALKRTGAPEVERILANLDDGPISEIQRARLATEIESAFNAREVIILDGLQRTYTIGDCITELRDKNPGSVGAFLRRNYLPSIQVRHSVLRRTRMVTSRPTHPQRCCGLRAKVARMSTCEVLI